MVGPSHWAEQAAKGSCGWPHHLTSFAQGLARSVLEMERKSPLADQDRMFENALEHGRALREAYYQARVVKLGAIRRAVVQALRAAFPTGRRSETASVGRLQEKLSQLAAPLLAANPQERMKLEDIWPLILRGGLVQPVSEAGLDCEIPIPSFRAFLLERWK